MNRKNYFLFFARPHFCIQRFHCFHYICSFVVGCATKCCPPKEFSLANIKVISSPAPEFLSLNVFFNTIKMRIIDQFLLQMTRHRLVFNASFLRMVLMSTCQSRLCLSQTCNGVLQTLHHLPSLDLCLVQYINIIFYACDMFE